jgi:hypothetical protein
VLLKFIFWHLLNKISPIFGEKNTQEDTNCPQGFCLLKENVFVSTATYSERQTVVDKRYYFKFLCDFKFLVMTMEMARVSFKKVRILDIQNFIFVDRASLSNLVNRTNWCKIFLNIFITFLYMFRATMCSSSGENTVPMRHLVFVTVCYAERNFHSSLHIRQSSIYSNKYEVSHRYGIFSWWWAHSCPKHVEKSNNFIKKNCALRWFYLQHIHIQLFHDKLSLYIWDNYVCIFTWFSI